MAGISLSRFARATQLSGKGFLSPLCRNIWSALPNAICVELRRGPRPTTVVETGRFLKDTRQYLPRRAALYRGNVDVEAVLEAAHIRPYVGPHTNSLRNGLLLRADIHTLFNLRLLSIEPKSYTVVLAPVLETSSYSGLRNVAVRRPNRANALPNTEALRSLRRLSSSRRCLRVAPADVPERCVPHLFDSSVGHFCDGSHPALAPDSRAFESALRAPAWLLALVIVGVPLLFFWGFQCIGGHLFASSKAGQIYAGVRP